MYILSIYQRKEIKVKRKTNFVFFSRNDQQVNGVVLY